MGHGSAEDLGARDWSLAALEKRVLLRPMHAEQPNESNDWDDGLKRHIVAGEHKKIDNVNILIAHLKLQSLHDLIELVLMTFQLLSGLQLVLGVYQSEVIVRIDDLNKRRHE